MTAALTAEMEEWLRDAAMIQMPRDMPVDEAVMTLFEWESCMQSALELGERAGLDGNAVLARYHEMLEGR